MLTDRDGKDFIVKFFSKSQFYDYYIFSENEDTCAGLKS